MNDQEVKRMISAICPDLKLSGCYRQIVPRITVQQLAQLLDAAERGENDRTWSWLAVEFFRYGQQELVAAEIDRLVAAVKASGSAVWVLMKVPNLAHRHLDMLVPLVTHSSNAAWVLAHAPHLSDANRNALVSLITGSYDAAWLLAKTSKLSDDHRDLLIPLITDSRDATWLLREAPNLSNENREHLATIGE